MFLCHHKCTCKKCIVYSILINNEECPSTYHDFIRVHYSVQTMCNSQDCTLFELLTNGLLDKTVSPERMQKHSNTLHFGC